jgi:hypothetical protein
VLARILWDISSIEDAGQGATQFDESDNELDPQYETKIKNSRRSVDSMRDSAWEAVALWQCHGWYLRIADTARPSLR